MPEATPLGADSQTTATTAAPSCGEAVVRLLEQYGVDTVFGIPGVHTLEMYRGLAASDPPCLAAPRAGRGVHGGRLRAHRKQARRLPPDHRRRSSRTPRRRSPAPSTTRSRCSSSRARPRTKSNGRGHGSLHDLPDQRAFMAHHHGRVDRRPRPGGAARGLRPRVRDLRLAAAAAGAHRHPDRRARPARAVVGAADGARRPPVADAALVERAVELLAGAARPMLLLGGGALPRAPRPRPWPSGSARPSA